MYPTDIRPLERAHLSEATGAQPHPRARSPENKCLAEQFCLLGLASPISRRSLTTSTLPLLAASRERCSAAELPESSLTSCCASHNSSTGANPPGQETRVVPGLRNLTYPG